MSIKNDLPPAKAVDTIVYKAKVSRFNKGETTV
jgi:hypothetical protein